MAAEIGPGKVDCVDSEPGFEAYSGTDEWWGITMRVYLLGVILNLM